MTSDLSPSDANRFSSQLADAVEATAASTLRVQGRARFPASGIAFAPDLVLTADHVLEPERERTIRLGLPDGSELSAALVGRDPTSDLAVLRASEASLIPAAPASAEPRVGSLAMAVARPGREPSASLALVAAVGGPVRTQRGGVLARAIRTERTLPPGFSGGPLVDTGGAVLGINTTGLLVGGLSVTIPWAMAMQLAAALVEHGHVVRGYLGIGSQPIALAPALRAVAGGRERGLLIVHVADGSPAAAAGLLQGDILLRLDGTPVADVEEVPQGDVLFHRPVPGEEELEVEDRIGEATFHRRVPGPGDHKRWILIQRGMLPPPGPEEFPIGPSPHLLFERRLGGPPGPGGPGMPPGPFMFRLRGEPVTDADHLQAFLGPERVGTSVTATLLRGGELRELAVTVAAREQRPA